MQPKIYFISGVCGVGKSSIIPHLKNFLPSDKFDVRDFDERGVPDGADRNWRKSEVKKWLEVGELSAQEGISTVVCGFVKRSDFEEVSTESIPEIKTVLLDADSETIRKRLMGRYSVNGVFDETKKVIGKPVTEFIESNVYYCDIMRKECVEEGWDVIETSDLTPEEVAEKVSQLVNF
jgi:broad-specificity NMP kinase